MREQVDLYGTLTGAPAAPPRREASGAKGEPGRSELAPVVQLTRKRAG